MAATQQRIVIEPNEGETVWLGGLGVIFKIAAEETGGAFAVVEHPIEPGRLVPPHTHENEDELSYVLEGEIGARVGDREVSVGPGSYLFKPRGIPHTFWNAGPAPARLLEIIFPAGFEQFFKELGALFASGDFTPEGREALAQGYGHYFVTDWAPELKARYNLKLLGE